MKNSAFTLIELLVVIAIIAILAALSMGALAKALERGRALSDAGTLRSIGPLFQRYLSDHDDEMPSNAGTGATTWPEQFHKLATDRKLLISPFDRRPIVDGSNSPVSYGINTNNFDVNAGDFVSPSELVMMTAFAKLSKNKPVFSGTASSNVAVQPATTHGIYRDNSYLNVLFADWHVVPMNYEVEVKDDSSLKGKKHWDPLYRPQ